MTLPPFERLYLAHRDDVHASLRRLLGRERADDAFQETFLRALRAYDRLAHADNLRAWLLAIARNVALDELRRTRPLDGAASTRAGRAAEERRRLRAARRPRGQLPAKERAAVVLRYAYDLDYDTIGAALGSSGEAAAPGRLLGSAPPAEGALMISDALDARLRAAAAAEGLLDAAYDVMDSPIGPLLLAATPRGLCRVGFRADPEEALEELARAYGPRILRSTEPLRGAQRELDAYFEGKRRVFDLHLDVAARASPAACSRSWRASRTARSSPTASLRVAPATRRRPARSG